MAAIITATGTAGIARQIIAICDEAIARGVDQLSYTANGRTVTRHGLSQIILVRDYYAKLLASVTGFRKTLAQFM